MSAIALRDGEQREDALLAIEDFLERTREYGTTRPPPGGATPMSDPPVPVARTQPPGTRGLFARDSLAATIPAADTFANTQMALSGSSSVRPVPTLPVVRSLSIRVPIPVDIPEARPVKTNTTNAPLAAVQAPVPVPWEPLLAHLRSQAREHRDFETAWRLWLVQLALGRDVETMSETTELPQSAQAILEVLLRTLVAVRDSVKDPISSSQRALSELDDLRIALSEQADPRVDTVALCRRVSTFGAYDEMSEADFVAGRPVPAIVYTEVRDLRSHLTDENLYETRLGTRLELLTTAGESVWRNEEPDIVDHCRRRRRDFFVAQRITLPPTLAAGDYVLKVFVEDKIAARAVETTKPLTISDPISLARGGNAPP